MMEFIRIYLGLCCLFTVLILIWTELDRVDIEEFYDDKDDE